MALATGPRVLLLDEPLAGMGPEESVRIVALLKTLAADHAVLLVEHDMDAVFAVADVLTVMVNGMVLESGAPAQIRSSPAVQEAYLGSEDAA
jgi:branched-chain amino acid transport system ATP-binding protein